MRRLIWLSHGGEGWTCSQPQKEHKKVVIKALWDCIAMTGMLLVAVLTILIVGL